MSLALINAVPLIMALAFLIPFVKNNVPKAVKVWVSTGVMLALFIGLISYFPQVQSLDQSYKEAQGIAQYDDGGGATMGAAVADASASPPANTDVDDAGTGDIPSVNAVIQDIQWVPELGLSLSFYLDGLSLIFGLIVTGIGAGIFLYTGYYFEDEDDYNRFAWMLSAFAGSMLGLVLSGNLLTLFIMWEGTSITSFLLIGFKGHKYEDARFGATQAFMVTGVGALALIAGIVLLAFITGDVTGAGGLIFDVQTIVTADASAIGASSLYTATLILLALGAFTKSAQFPFHFWLPGAMAAPTPASAYLHSATMVKAGIYLLLRLYPPMHANELWTTLLVTVGIGTMFIAAFIALFQRDLKGLLAYSTVSWLGALVGMIGLPDYAGFKAVFVGIIAHALYKAALFLAAGTIDHNTGTRIIDKLGGLRKQMPVIAGVVIVSALSMAGLPIFFGFVAKEVLLKDWTSVAFAGQQLSYYTIIVSAALTGTAGYIFIWDVFFKEPTAEIHYHASPMPMLITPVLLAVGTTIFGFLLDPPVAFVDNLIATAIPKSVDIHLLPSSPVDPVFLTSMAIVAAGFLVFLVRGAWLPVLQSLPLPRATDAYKGIMNAVDWIGDQVVKTQSGQIRYYLVVIFATVATTTLSTGIVVDLAISQTFDFAFGELFTSAAVALRAMLLLLAIVAAFMTVIFRSHIYAALSISVMGYAVGGLFLLEPAPDVSMVQFLMETLATILLIIMLGRISSKQRRDVMTKLWAGASKVGNINIGIIRDVLISGAVGLSVFFFSLTALTNRSDRSSISEYHLEQTFEQVGITDVVGAIVADYRAMDTFVEAGVFAVAALGVLSLLTRGLAQFNPFVPARKNVKEQQEFSESSLEEVTDATNLDTPFTRMVARIVLPLTLLIAISHLVNGAFGPGDGFTAGAIAGLGTALWFVVFGYRDAKQRLSIFSPHRLLRVGMFVLMINGLLPVFFGLQKGAFLAYVDYSKLIGIDGVLDTFGLKLTSSLIFEIGIALVVFGGITLIMEAIAHPTDTLRQDFDPSAKEMPQHD